ncbi:MAG: hypothetical protein GF347_04875 [Candidatus Moranbacteria bacterium]|nr:hypothetical protein [Candidatus Moranbacteria bacterium]
MKKREDVNLKDSLKKLKEVVKWFENQEEIDVEKGLNNVKKGVKLVKQCKKRLGEIENEFKELKKDLD